MRLDQQSVRNWALPIPFVGYSLSKIYLYESPNNRFFTLGEY
jgi:hypothetical protein